MLCMWHWEQYTGWNKIHAKSQPHDNTWSDFVMKSMFKYYLNMCSMMSAILLHHGVKTTPFADALVQERLAEFLPCLVWVCRLRRNFDSGRPSAAGHPTRSNQPDLNLDLAATCLAQRTGCSHAACNIACFWPCASANGVVVLTPWYSRMTKYWAHVQIIFKHWFHDEIRPGFIMWSWFFSIVKHHGLLPSVIWNRDSYSPDGATVVHN